MGYITIDVDINLSSDDGSATDDDYARAEASIEHLPHILTQVTAERCRLDMNGDGDGAPHEPVDWELFIQAQISGLTRADGEPMPGYRDTLIKIAALACAAAQSWDRQNKKEG